MEIVGVLVFGLGFLFVRVIYRDVQRDNRRQRRLPANAHRARISPQRPALPATSAPGAAPDGAGTWRDAFVEGLGEGVAAETERHGDHGGQVSGWRPANAGATVDEPHPPLTVEYQHGQVELEDPGDDGDTDDDTDASESGSGWSWDDD